MATAIETIAVILAVIILLKAVWMFFDRKGIMKFGKKFWKKKNRSLLVFIYLILAIIIGAFVFAELTIVQIFAVLALVGILYDLFLIRYMDPLIKEVEKGMRKGFTALELVVWLAFILGSIAVLLSVFYA